MILLTGTSGFVGQNLMKYLERFGISQYAISRQKLNSTNFTINNNIDSLVHLAGKAHDLKLATDSSDYIEVNFELTRKLYDVFLLSNCTKFIFISSVKAVTDRPGSILTEEFVPNPKTPYGRSKLMAEKYIQDQPLPRGKYFYILRPCMIHGPGNKGNLNLLHDLIDRGIPYPLAAFENKRSFLSIENLCFVISELLQRDDIPSGAYNVADDEPLSTNEVVEILCQGSGKIPQLWKVPKRIVFVLAKMGDILGSIFTSEKLRKLTESYIVSNCKLKKALGKELPLSSRDGLLLTAKSFRTRLSI